MVAIADIHERARSLVGCLSHLKTTSYERQFKSDEDPLDMRHPFVSDEAKLECSKAFRVLCDKTQVATLPENPLIRKRSTHTMEVVACGVVTADILGLNIDLTRAIAVGHDIGHVPFGHQGEEFLKEVMDKPTFCHEVMGPIIAQKIERHGLGLNLTHETLEGMMCHSGNFAHEGMTPEAWVIRYVDKFAYIFADWNDIVIRMRFPVPLELVTYMDMFGCTQRERTSTAIAALVEESAECGRVSFEHSEYAETFRKIRKMMYEIYPRVTHQNTRRALEPVLEFLTRLKLGDPFLLLALMTDRDVIHLSAQKMPNVTHLHQTAISEILPLIGNIGPIDLCDPCLDW